MSKVVSAKFILLIAALAFSGCLRKAPADIKPAPKRVVFDDLQKPVSLPEKVDRAISLAPNLTESVFAIGAGSKLIGATTYCNFPSEAEKIKKIGDTMNPNIESILALKPQVVLVSTASQLQNFTKLLEENGIAVFVTDSQGLDGVYKNLTQLGEILGEEAKAAEMIVALRKRVAEIERKVEKAAKVKLFIQISKEPLFTAGSKSFITDLASRAKGDSISAGIPEAYPRLSKEFALASEPEVIILSDSPDNQDPNEIFKDSPAFRKNRIRRINADILSRPGPRMIDALEEIAKAAHPELFE